MSGGESTNSPCLWFNWFELQKLPMSSQPQVPLGPLPMVPEGQAESSKWTEALLSTWMRISEVLLGLFYFWIM